MKQLLRIVAPWLALALSPLSARSFCGFYVASGDAKLFNRASQVVLVRDGDRTVMTMANDYKGDPKEFAMVIPVPTVLQKEQVHVGDPALVEHLDRYSAPRLVEYFDPDPCPAPAVAKYLNGLAVRGGRPNEVAVGILRSISGVKIEAQFTVDEYDIVILSATESGALEAWLRAHRYRVPAGAARVLATYIKQDMKFFVAKVNLKQQQKLGFQALRPIQVAYESPKFMLPIRLGMANADGPQELFVYALTRRGRVEAVNYRTMKLPCDRDVPEYVKEVWPDFYRALVAEQVKREGMQSVFTEYAWDMGWCDPCSAEPLSADELQNLGVFWMADAEPGRPTQSPFVTRLHLRYDAAHYPEDLVLQETADHENWQAKFVMRHPWKGKAECPAGIEYRNQLHERQEVEARNLSDLTGWRLNTIRTAMGLDDWAPARELKWYEKLWKN